MTSYKFLLLSLLFIESIVFGLETKLSLHPRHYKQKVEHSVFCASDYRGWQWLKDEKGRYVTIEGYPSSLPLVESNPNPPNDDEYYITLFFIDNAYDTVKELEKKCINKYGAEFKYAQPAIDRFSKWYIFADENNYYSGHITVFFYKKGSSIKSAIQLLHQYTAIGDFFERFYIPDKNNFN